MGEILIYSDFLKTYKTRGYRINHLERYKNLFPIVSSPQLAGIVADLMGDGHLQGNPIWRGDYTSKSLKELKRFGHEIHSLFHTSCKIRKCNSNTYGLTYNTGINCAPIARILMLIGVPIGQKVLKSFRIPDWIKKDKECFRRFCQRLFTCEGGILNETGRKPRIRLEMWKSEKLIKDGVEFMNEVAQGLKRYFKIESSVIIQNKTNIRKDGIITRPIRLSISTGSTPKFFDRVGFEGDKQKSLKALLIK